MELSLLECLSSMFSLLASTMTVFEISLTWPVSPFSLVPREGFRKVFLSLKVICTNSISILRAGQETNRAQRKWTVKRLCCIQQASKDPFQQPLNGSECSERRSTDCTLIFKHRNPPINQTVTHGFLLFMGSWFSSSSITQKSLSVLAYETTFYFRTESLKVCNSNFPRI